MSKAVLVMNMPEDCPTCTFFDSDGNCHATNPDDTWTTDTEKAKPDWCPLRELPEKKETFTTLECHSNGRWTEGMKVGWNACLDEITR